MVDGKGELHTLQRPALTHDTCGLNARPLLLLGALAQLLSGKFVLSHQYQPPVLIKDDNLSIFILISIADKDFPQ